MDASSDSSSGSSSKQKNNGKASSSSKPGDVPPGETSLTDVHLLLAVQQLADTKTGTQQLVLHQVRGGGGLARFWLLEGPHHCPVVCACGHSPACHTTHAPATHTGPEHPGGAA
jgi:hypothetical protein